LRRTGGIIRRIDAWVSPDGSETARFARLRRRALAGAIDWTVCAVIYLIVSIPAGMVQIVGGWAIVEGGGTLGRVLVVSSQVLVAAAVVAYLALGLRTGQTLGMRAIEVHARVADSGRPPGLARSVARSLLGVLFALAVVNAYFGLRGEAPIGGLSDVEELVFDVALVVASVAILGKLWALVDAEGQTLWDRLFGLIVLEDLDARDTADVDYGSWLRRRARAPS
jgi:RDD family